MREQDFEDRLAGWLEDGPATAPDAPVEAAIEHARSHPRRAHWWSVTPWRGPAPDLLAPAPTWRVGPRVRLVWVLVVVGAVLALLAATLIGSRWSTIVQLPGNGRLAFSFEGDLWTVGLDGTASRLTTTGLETESAPVWSPDGRWLAFRVETVTEPRSFRIDVLEVSTGRRRTLAEGGLAAAGRLAFSPDGRLVAFGFGRGTLPSLTVASLDGSSSTRTVTALSGTSPAFSPDGTRVVFVGRAPEASRTDVYVADVATLRATRLTSYEQLGLGWVSSPSWAEGGRSIVFEAAVVDPTGALGRHIYAVGPDGRGLRLLGPAAGWREAHDFEAAPVVSPDGGRVAFQGDGTLQVLDVRTGAASGLASPPDLKLGAGGIAWAPDATAVAVLHWRECPGAAGTICPEGLTVVPAGPAAATAQRPWTAPVSGPVTAPSFSWDLAWQPAPASPGGAR